VLTEGSFAHANPSPAVAVQECCFCPMIFAALSYPSPLLERIGQVVGLPSSDW